VTFVAGVENITSDSHFCEKKQIEQLEMSVMRNLIRACFAAILVATIVGPAASDPVPSDTPWAVLRCVGNDVDPSIYLKTPVPPAYANNTEGFLKDMFTAAGKGKGGLYDYWGQVSQNPDLMKGTSLFPWVTLDMSNLQYWNLPIPTGEQPLRTFVQTCLDQYIKKGTATVGTGQPNDLNSYYGLIVISYIPTAGGEQGQHDLSLTINGAPWRASTGVPAVGTTFDSISPKATGHEMGHGYGLAHASCASKPSNDGDKDYCDSYDVMGDYGALYTNSNFALSLSVTNQSHSSTATANLGWSGPGLNAPHLAYLGWLPSARTCALGAGACEFVTGGLEVTLAALGHSEAPGVFQVGIPSSIAPLGGYTVEFRRGSTCASPSIGPVGIRPCRTRYKSTPDGNRRANRILCLSTTEGAHCGLRARCSMTEPYRY
jgi:hypothetical protein